MKFEYNGHDLYIDKILAIQLLSLVNNINKDWDFVILISGDRMVRVGKSVLAMTCAAFLAKAMNDNKLSTSFSLKDVYFNNEEMMIAAYDKPPYSINVYDEGREALAASKTMMRIQQSLLDFFAECGQLNQIFIIVLPDFFEMKEQIAVGRSELLLNVYRRPVLQEKKMLATDELFPVVKFQRGYFQFFNRERKAKLYDISKSTRKKNYALVKANVIGRFTNQYPFDEQAYRDKKRKALKRFKKEDKILMGGKHYERLYLQKWRDPIIRSWYNELKEADPNLTYRSAAKSLQVRLEETFKESLAPATIYDILRSHKKKGGKAKS